MSLAFPYPDVPGDSEAVEVAPGIFWLRLPLPMKLNHINVYALADDDGWTIIDTGLDTALTRSLWEGALAGPLAGRPVVRVLLTHHHVDHVGLAGWFMDQGAALLTSRTAYLTARMLILDVQDAPTPEQVTFWQRSGMPAEMRDARMGVRPFNMGDTCTPLPLGYRRIVEGETLRLGGRDWTVRMGNGHAPEHITLWSDDIVIAGDQALPGISPNLGVHQTEPMADPVGEWMESCAHLQSFATDTQMVLPGHELPFTGLKTRLKALISNHRSALDRLERALAETPMTAVDCFSVLYRRRIGDGEYGLALAEAVGHINHLALTNRARPAGLTPDGGQLWQASNVPARA